MSKIVIGIACHKPSELPKNDLYLPIHVGAAVSNTVLPGLQRDDEGDSISEKNANYCELTAQYWLWKNVDADYYGLCHYRRFMSFAPERFDNLSEDHRGQVAIASLNDYTMHRYCLDNEQAMRDIIEAYDIVATEEQDLSRVFTPRGLQNTVYKHFAAHDHDLINVHDLDAMLAIVDAKYPQYIDDMLEYLNRPYFRGFNCFVMAKDLFFELCEFEFDVLAELEKIVDMSSYDLTRSRVYGFMAEILYSSFVYHVRKRRGARVCDVQMLYFMDTDQKRAILPIEGALQVIFDATKIPSFLFDVTVRSFLSSLDESKNYDVLVLHNEFTAFYLKYFKEQFDDAGNVSVRFIDWGKIIGALADVAVEHGGMRRLSGAKEDLGAYLDLPRLYLPWVLPSYKRTIIFGWSLLFEKGWTSLADTDLKGDMVGAAKDVLWQGEANGVFDERRKYFRDFLNLDDFSCLFDTEVLICDFEKFRESGSISDMFRYVFSFGEPLPEKDLLNTLCGKKAFFIDQCFNVKVSNDSDFRDALRDLPTALAKEYQSAKGCPAIIQYDGYDPWWMVGTEYELKYWKIARSSDLYEAFLGHMTYLHKTDYRPNVGPLRHRLNILLPKGTKRRMFFRALFPHGSKQYRFVKDIVRRVAN